MSHKTNSWEEEDVKRGKKQQREGHLGHARALFDDAHGSYNYDGHNSTGAEHHDGHPFKNITRYLTGSKESAAKNKGVLYNKGMMDHPAKMSDYGDPAPKSNAFIGAKVAAEKSGKDSFTVGGEKFPLRMSENLSNDVLGDDMNLTGQGYAKDEGGNTRMMEPTRMMQPLKNLYGMRK